MARRVSAGHQDAQARSDGRRPIERLEEPRRLERLEALGAAHELLQPGGRLVFDVFTPSREDIEATHGRWIEREPGIDERADWDLEAQTLTLSVRGPVGSSTMTLWWVEPERWHSLLAEAGFEVLACYGWFDRRPFEGGEDSVWIAGRA